MPTYAYTCTVCDHSFDVHQSFDDAPLTVCPECSGRLRKVFTPVGVVFKGSGFYHTDARADGKHGHAAQPGATPHGSSGAESAAEGSSTSGGSEGPSGASSSGTSSPSESSSGASSSSDGAGTTKTPSPSAPAASAAKAAGS
ncbi:MAG: FmdB family transcriptional regulator [Micrococcales bacterium]|nr:FmdB family transcriptional regulator [Micrococcales bacterium]